MIATIVTRNYHTVSNLFWCGSAGPGIPYESYHTIPYGTLPTLPESALFSSLASFISFPQLLSLSFFSLSLLSILTIIHSFHKTSLPQGPTPTCKVPSFIVSFHCFTYGGLSRFAFPCSRPLTCSSHAAFRPSFRPRISFLVNSPSLISFSPTRPHYDDLGCS